MNVYRFICTCIVYEKMLKMMLEFAAWAKWKYRALIFTAAIT